MANCSLFAVWLAHQRVDSDLIALAAGSMTHLTLLQIIDVDARETSHKASPVISVMPARMTAKPAGH
jgi:hypothetical protein